MLSKIKSFFLILCSYVFCLPIQAETLKDRLKKFGSGEEYGLGYEDISGNEDMAFLDAIGSTIKVILGFLGVIFVILIIYGGFLWMTAQGNDEQVGKARKIIVNSSLGLAVIMLAYLITWFIVYQLGEATGIETNL